MTNKKIYFFIGTMAEFIKLSPIIKKLNEEEIKYKIISSGQNELNIQSLKDFYGKVTIDILFPHKPRNASIPQFLIWSVRTFYLGIFKLNKEFKKLDKNNSYFIIHGDTVSSLIGSILAKIHRIKLVQVESGLRSYHFFEPFPEEISRFIISYLANIFFPPTKWAKKNLVKFKAPKICTINNTLIEPCLWAINQKQGTKFKKQFNKYYVLFIHRQENIYFHKNRTIKTIEYIINNAPPNLNCVFIMHPLTIRLLDKTNLNLSAKNSQKLHKVPTMTYIDFMGLLSNAQFIATDGCTVQEEAYYLGLPYLALRNRTERIEGLNNNVILGKNNEHIMKNFLINYTKFRKPKVAYKIKPSHVITKYLLNK